MKRPTLNRFRASPGHSGLLLPPSVDKVGRAPGEQVGPGLLADIRPRETVADSVIARDVSGYGALADGLAGNCFSFDGINDYVNCQNPTGLQVTSSFTAGVWIRTAAADDVIMGRWQPTGNQRSFYFGTDATGQLTVRFSTDGINNNGRSGSLEVTNDNWRFVAVFFEPSTRFRFYVDGKLDAELTNTIPASLFNGTADFLIGARNAGAAGNFNGEIAGAFIYSEICSDDDIAWAFRHKRLPHQRFGSLLSASDLKGYWPMSEGFQDANYTLVLDHSGNGNHGMNINGGATPVSAEETIPQIVNSSFARAIRFDGANDNISITPPGTDLNTDFTWSFLIGRPDWDADYGVLWLWQVDVNNKVQLTSRADNGRIRIQVVVAGSGQTLASDFDFVDNKFYHFIAVHTASTKTVAFYVNGQSAGSDTYTLTLPSSGGVTGQLLSSQITGIADELSWFDRALDATEAAELANSGVPIDARRHSRASDLVGYWRNGWLTSTGDWEDLSTNSNDGTVNGTPDTVVLQALPDNPTRHALGGFVRQDKGFSFPESGVVRLLGPHVAENPDLENECEGWDVGAGGCNTRTFYDGYVEVVNQGGGDCIILRRDDVDWKLNSYYRYRLVVDSFSATAGIVYLIINGGSRGAITAAGIYEGTFQWTDVEDRVQLNAGGPSALNARISHLSVKEVILPNLFAGGGTISAWIRPISLGGNNVGRIADKAGWRLNVADASAGVCDVLFWHDFDGVTDGQWSTTSRLLALGSWNHVVVVYDSDAVGNNPAVYVNGVSAAVTEDTAPVGSAVDNASDPAYIGNDAGALNAFDGDIDKQSFHNRELTATEVLRLFNAQRDEYGV